MLHAAEQAIATLPPSLITSADSAIMDINAVSMGFDLWQLMQRAGNELANYTQSIVHNQNARITVCCGGGNNGGDGYVAAHILHRLGYPIRLFQSQPPQSPLCQQAAEEFETQTLNSLIISDPLENQPDLIIDAMLGAGQKGPLRPRITPTIQALNASAIPILACDVPTGYGQADGLRAEYILSMQCQKQLSHYPNSSFYNADLGIPNQCWLEMGPAYFDDFPRYNPQSHKGQNGRVLVIGGGTFPGAQHFACQAALRTGCDLVYAWTTVSASLPPSIIPLMQANPAYHLHLDAEDIPRLHTHIAQCDAILIGPGIGTHPASQRCAQIAFDVAQELQKKVVLDADGLSACSEQICALDSASKQDLILTPHRAEMSRLLRKNQAEWQDCHLFAAEHGLCILLKGMTDFISDGKQWQYNQNGNPRMSVGGTGDLLAGLCAGLLARNHRPFSAARTAVYWLCACADDCWEKLGPSYRPEDIESNLGPILKQLLEPHLTRS